MKGFRDFLLQGNLVMLAVAVIIGGAFGEVVTAFTAILTDIIGKFGGVPDFSKTSVAGLSVGAFITAVLGFILTAAVLYFLVVTPYNKVTERLKKAEDQVAAAPAVTDVDLLTEIRDLLRNQASATAPQPGALPTEGSSRS